MAINYNCGTYYKINQGGSTSDYYMNWPSYGYGNWMVTNHKDDQQYEYVTPVANYIATRSASITKTREWSVTGSTLNPYFISIYVKSSIWNKYKKVDGAIDTSIIYDRKWSTTLEDVFVYVPGDTGEGTNIYSAHSAKPSDYDNNRIADEGEYVWVQDSNPFINKYTMYFSVMTNGYQAGVKSRYIIPLLQIGFKPSYETLSNDPPGVAYYNNRDNNLILYISSFADTGITKIGLCNENKFREMISEASDGVTTMFIESNSVPGDSSSSSDINNIRYNFRMYISTDPKTWGQTFMIYPNLTQIFDAQAKVRDDLITLQEIVLGIKSEIATLKAGSGDDDYSVC